MVYLSNLCNLGCSYCYVAVNQGPARKLELPAVIRSIDYFFQIDPAPGSKLVSFLGGEPLLDFPFLIESIRHIRNIRGGQDAINVYTNGVLLEKRKVELMLEFGVRIIVSLDGSRNDNDLNRVFAGKKPSSSVYDAVMKRLEKIPKDSLSINMVVSPLTAPRLVQNVQFLRSIGFQSINIYPDFKAIWPRKALAQFDDSMKDFEIFYASLFRATKTKPFSIASFSSILLRESAIRSGNTHWWKECGNLIIGPDGNFHVCDKAFDSPLKKGHDSIVGNPSKGLDWEKRGARYAEAFRWIQEQSAAAGWHFCPMGSYFGQLWYGKSGRQSFQMTLDLASIMSRTFLSLAEKLKNDLMFQSMYGRAQFLEASIAGSATTL
jgi:sulfatase maturation enzyme AslB (radical SAM superfamily)